MSIFSRVVNKNAIHAILFAISFKWMKIILSSLLILLLITEDFSAQLNVVRHKVLPMTNDTISLDSLSILPGSLVIYANGSLLEESKYQYDWLTSRLIFTKEISCDSLRLDFKVIPFVIPKNYYNKPISLLSPDPLIFLDPFVIHPEGDESNADAGLETNGALSRGLQVGNAQSVSVNSSLNLQISGKINNRFFVAGMISDNNVPIQPGGETKQLDELDRIFIQVNDAKNKLTAGDFQLNKPQGYFLTYFKRAQGTLYQRGQESKGEDYWEASASVSKGRFARNVIQGIEGNQGPYRLSGAEGETFIVVLAGTEQVFIDGRLLQRGQDADYVMDYNSAEISFTPRQFITKDRRIVVEFQYSDKRYARPLFTASVFKTSSRGHYYVNVYSESDAKNQPLQQELSDADKELLGSSGDDPLGATRSGIRLGNFEYNQVMYILKDSLGFDSVLVYSSDTAKARATASFSFVGAGHGDYVEDGFTPAGKKYRWLLPQISGNDTIHYGNYSPVYVLFAPSIQQMISGGGRWQISEALVVSAEAAVSNRDRNSFSYQGNSDNVGSAFQVNVMLGRAQTQRKISLSAEGRYEYVNRRFSPVERFREVEFARNWNLPATFQSGDQHEFHVAPVMRFKRAGFVKIGVDYLDAKGLQQGKKIISTVKLERKDNWKVDGTGSYLKVNGANVSEFLRHKSEWTKWLGAFSLIFRDEHERNMKLDDDKSFLRNDSYRFYDWEGSIGTTDTVNRVVRIHYRQRFEQRPDSASLLPASRAEQYGILSRYQWSEGNYLGVMASNRRLEVIRTDLLAATPENTLVGRVEHALRARKGGIVGATFYEVGSGLEQRRSFFYTEVAPGQGTHVWVDYNNDGIRDLNEFEVAPFDYEANFIRVSAPGNDYVKSFTNVLNQSIQLNLNRFSGDSNKFRRFIGRWSDAALWRQERKTSSSSPQAQLDPFYNWQLDTSLMTVSGVLRNVVFFNRNSSLYAADFTYQKTSRTELLLGGSNALEEIVMSAQMRYTFFEELTLFNILSRNTKSQNSEILLGRNFNLLMENVETRCLWQRSANRSLELRGKYASKREINGLASGNVRELGLIFTQNNIDKSAVTMSLEYISISLYGDGNTPVAYEILEGLSHGENITWNITWQHTVAKNLQMNLTYQGRDANDRKAIHVASLQLRATF